MGGRVYSSGHLVWHAFLGGPGVNTNLDYGRAIAVDAAGSIYVGGDSPATWGTPVTVAGFGSFIAKLRCRWKPHLERLSRQFPEFMDWLSTVLEMYTSRAEAAADGELQSMVAAATLKVTLRNWIQMAKLNGIRLLAAPAMTWLRSGVDAIGNIYVTGISAVGWGAPVQPFTGGGEDVFVAKSGQPENEFGIHSWR